MKEKEREDTKEKGRREEERRSEVRGKREENTTSIYDRIHWRFREY